MDVCNLIPSGDIDHDRSEEIDHDRSQEIDPDQSEDEFSDQYKYSKDRDNSEESGIIYTDRSQQARQRELKVKFMRRYRGTIL